MAGQGNSIGGYFGLESYAGGSPHSNAIGFQSARAAIRSFFHQRSVSRVWLPAYICQTVVDALNDTGVGLAFYLLDEAWLPDIAPSSLSESDGLLVVNYFGVMDDALNDWIAGAQPHPRTTLIDCSQALGFVPTTGFSSVYSPRKFAGLPDGGLLIADDIKAPTIRDDQSINRVEHLLVRMAEGPEAGYERFTKAESQLSESEPKAMSLLTEKLLASYSWSAMFEKRQSNFQRLEDALGPINLWRLSARSRSPLVYPFQADDAQAVRRRLQQHRIYCPHYWPECRNEVYKNTSVAKLVDNTVFLPVDHRMGAPECDTIIAHILNREQRR